ncbi:MAG: hypothetical protein ABWZ58_02640 [Acidimicrobiia bacterium]|jgi:hypothetical protein|nr:hypothetical protein [Acidimicrobiia bacterium]
MLNFIAGYLAIWVISEVFPEGFVNRTEGLLESPVSVIPFKSTPGDRIRTGRTVIERRVT